MIVLTGHDLSRQQLVRVARQREPVELHPAALEAMAVARAVVDRSLARGEPVYGLSTAVGVLKRVAVGSATAASYSKPGAGPEPPLSVNTRTATKMEPLG